MKIQDPSTMFASEEVEDRIGERRRCVSLMAVIIVSDFLLFGFLLLLLLLPVASFSILCRVFL